MSEFKLCSASKSINPLTRIIMSTIGCLNDYINHEYIKDIIYKDKVVNGDGYFRNFKYKKYSIEIECKDGKRALIGTPINIASFVWQLEYHRCNSDITDDKGKDRWNLRFVT